MTTNFQLFATASHLAFIQPPMRYMPNIILSFIIIPIPMSVCSEYSEIRFNLLFPLRVKNIILMHCCNCNHSLVAQLYDDAMR